MDELNERAKQFIERARPAFAADADALARVRARLDEVPRPPDDEGSTSSGTGGVGRWALLGVAIAIVGVMGAATLLDRGNAAPPPSAPASATEVEPAPPPRAEAEVTKDDVPPDPALARPPAAADVSDPPPPSARRRPRRPTVRVVEPVAPEDDTFREQLELIVASRRALSRASFADARSNAQRYRERFPSGAFAEEAEVLDLLARCGLGREAAAVREATQYVAGKQSAFATRVRRACLADDDASDPTQ